MAASWPKIAIQRIKIMVRNRIHVPPWLRRITFTIWSVIFVAPYFNLAFFGLHDLHRFTPKSKEIPCLLTFALLLCLQLGLAWQCPLRLFWVSDRLARARMISLPNAAPVWSRVDQAPLAVRLNW